MTTIQCRDGQNVHHCKCDGEEGRHAPEDAPNPLVGEYLANGDEATHALISFSLGGEDEFDLFPIIIQLRKSLLETCRDGLEEGVFLGLQVIIIGQISLAICAYHTFLGKMHRD